MQIKIETPLSSICRKKFLKGFFERLPRWLNKSKVSVRKILKIFGSFSGLANSVAEIVCDRQRKPAWLVIISKKHPSMHSSITPGVKSSRKTIPVFPERIIKFKSSKMIFNPLIHNVPKWSGTF